MSKNRYVNTKFWDDDYVSNLDSDEKLLFIYYLTNPLTSICGIYEISLRRMEFDLKLKQEKILIILKKFQEEKKIYYKDGWIFIINFIKHQAVNSNIKKGIKSEISKIPNNIASWILSNLSKEFEIFTYISESFESLLKDLKEVKREPKPLNYININSKEKKGDLKEIKSVSEIPNNIIEIYQKYPSRCPIKGSSTNKSNKDKDKIKDLLKKHSKNTLLESIKYYVSNCKDTKTYLKNFKTFLNNLPDLEELKKNNHPIDERKLQNSGNYETNDEYINKKLKEFESEFEEEVEFYIDKFKNKDQKYKKGIQYFKNTKNPEPGEVKFGMNEYRYKDFLEKKEDKLFVVKNKKLVVTNDLETYKINARKRFIEKVKKEQNNK